MKRMLFSTTVLSALILSGGCKEETPKPAGGPSGTPAATQAGSIGAKGDEHTGTKHELGMQTIGGYNVKAARFADLKPGEEAVVELEVTGGAGKPKAVRAWIGTESGEGSAKARGEGKEDDYDIHVEVPATLAADAKLWVEIETGDGKPRGSFDLKR
jgi:hypothetical protein